MNYGARNLGGCRKLAAEYRAIGISLLRFEFACSAMLVSPNSIAALNEMRTDVADISTETLEAYLDDLIDVTIPLEALSLIRGRINFLSSFGVTLIALGVAALVAFVTVTTTFPLATSTAASPFILVASLFALSRHHSVRRLRFAHIMRSVIAARKGSGGGKNIIKRPLMLVTPHARSAAA